MSILKIGYTNFLNYVSELKNVSVDKIFVATYGIDKDKMCGLVRVCGSWEYIIQK